MWSAYHCTTRYGWCVFLVRASAWLNTWSCLSVCLSVRLFQLASELSHDVVARRRSDYCPHGAIFGYKLLSLVVVILKISPLLTHFHVISVPSKGWPKYDLKSWQNRKIQNCRKSPTWKHFELRKNLKFDAPPPSWPTLGEMEIQTFLRLLYPLRLLLIQCLNLIKMIFHHYFDPILIISWRNLTCTYLIQI